MQVEFNQEMQGKIAAAVDTILSGVCSKVVISDDV